MKYVFSTGCIYTVHVLDHRLLHELKMSKTRYKYLVIRINTFKPNYNPNRLKLLNKKKSKVRAIISGVLIFRVR